MREGASEKRQAFFFESLAFLGLIAAAVGVAGLEGCGRSESSDAAAWVAVAADA